MLPLRLQPFKMPALYAGFRLFTAVRMPTSTTPAPSSPASSKHRHHPQAAAAVVMQAPSPTAGANGLPTTSTTASCTTRILKINPASFVFASPEQLAAHGLAPVPYPRRLAALPAPRLPPPTLLPFALDPSVSSHLEDYAALLEAAQLLAGGQVVAVPTETVYGLAANALDAGAVARIFAAKGRPSDNPLIAHVGDLQQAHDLLRGHVSGSTVSSSGTVSGSGGCERLAGGSERKTGGSAAAAADTLVAGAAAAGDAAAGTPAGAAAAGGRTDEAGGTGPAAAGGENTGDAAGLPAVYDEMASRFWPGPLTVLCPKPACVPGAVTAGQETLALRLPSHRVARALACLCSFPLAAPSANRSGRPSPTCAEHVIADLGGRVPLLLDGGPCERGIESTVVDGLRADGMRVVLRPGSVTAEEIRELPGWQDVRVWKVSYDDAELEATPTTPGMKYRHYAPDAEVILVAQVPTPATQPVGGTHTQLRSSSSSSTTTTAAPGAATSRSLLISNRDGAGPSSSGGGDGDGGLSPNPSPWVAAIAGEVAAAIQARGAGCRVGVLRSSGEPLPRALLPPGADVIELPLHLPRQQTADQAKGYVSDSGGVEQRQQQQQQQQTMGNGAAADAANGSLMSSGRPEGRPAGTAMPQEGEGEEEEAEAAAVGLVAQNLFGGLRQLDSLGCAVIVIEGVAERGEGVAVMNRVRKAAGRTVAVSG